MPLKILHIIQKPQLRGAELFASQLGNHLLDQGHEVKLLALQDGNAQLPFRGKFINMQRPASQRLVDVGGWKKLAREIKVFHPDVVQANASDTLKYAVLSKLLFRWKPPIVFRNASTISLYIKSPIVKGWNAFLFRQVNHVISVSKTSQQDFIKVFPFIKERTTVIGIGIDCDALMSPQVSATSYVLHVGGFTFEKNHKGLLQIFSKLLVAHPGLELWLAGDGPLRPEIEQEAQVLGIYPQVRFLGYQNNVLPLMKGAKALLLPSIIEGLPGVILEAMYCHTPVVAYDVGGIAEIVRNGSTGWLVKLGDEEGFIKAVDEVLKCGIQSITEAAYTMVVSEFDNRIVTRRFLEVYARVVREPPLVGVPE